MTPDIDARPLALEKNNLIYEALLSQLDRKLADGPETALRHVERIGEFALYHHPGRFADGAVENVAFRIGRSLNEAPAGAPALEARIRRDPRPKTLHVANMVHAIGGHTRIICKCMATDPESVHVLVLTDQRVEVPSFLTEIIERVGGQLIVLATGESKLERARQLRSIARECARVFIVTYPQDPIPVVAFAADDLPPVAMSNHAHYSFCLGSTVADLVVNHVPYHLDAVTRRFRSPRHAEMLLCFPALAAFDPIDKAAAKRALGFSDGDTLLLAMAYTTYWVPNHEYDFFRTASKILELDPRVHVLMVGPDARDPNILQRMPDSPRFHLRGPIEQPAQYYQAADAALESFPIPSPGSAAEAVAYGGAYPIPKYGRGESILCFDVPVLSSFVKRARNEGAYIAQLKTFLDDLPEHRRRAGEIREALIAFDRAGPGRLQAMYARLAAIGHQPREIPAAPCSRAADSQSVAAISLDPWARPASLPATITIPEFSPTECRHYYRLAAERGCLRADDMADTLAELASGRAALDDDLRRLRDRMDELQGSLGTVERELQKSSSHALELEHQLQSSCEALAAQQRELVRQQERLSGQEDLLRAQSESIALQGDRLERIDRHWAVRLYRRLRSPGRVLRAWRLRDG